MKHLVLGIIIVFCLQLGYVAYTAINSPLGELAAVDEIATGAAPIADPEPAADLSSEDADSNSYRSETEKIRSASEPRKNKHFAGINEVSNSEVGKLPVSRTVNRRPQFAASRKSLETKIVIEYPQVIPVERESANYQLSARIIQSSKKRSLISKSFSILKKPYDWAKALGSRIN